MREHVTDINREHFSFSGHSFLNWMVWTMQWIHVQGFIDIERTILDCNISFCITPLDFMVFFYYKRVCLDLILDFTICFVSNLNTTLNQLQSILANWISSTLFLLFITDRMFDYQLIPEFGGVATVIQWIRCVEMLCNLYKRTGVELILPLHLQNGDLAVYQ